MRAPFEISGNDWHLVNEDFVGSDTNRAVLVKLKDPGALARAQGSVAAFAQNIAPATIESKVYSTLADKLRDALKQQNVAADVTVVEPASWKQATSGSIWGSDLGYIVGGAGIIGVLAWGFTKIMTRKKR